MGLVESVCDGPGIRRIGHGKGFSFRDANGKRVADEETVERIDLLAIPPAWKEVWICPDRRGHIQATGVDDAGRRQYIYHEDWTANASAAKYEDMLDFARTLPALRRRIVKNLKADGMPKRRALGLAARLLDRMLIRVGGEAYAEDNNTFGLATMRRDHVTVRGATLRFTYEAKGSAERSDVLADKSASVAVKELLARDDESPELLAYRASGVWHDIRSDDVNVFIKRHTVDSASAKSFRSWGATVLAARGLALEDVEVTEVIADVAEVLGNTPAVCRNSYIDPRAIAAFEAGKTIDPAVAEFDASNSRNRNRLDAAVLALIESTDSG